MKPPARQAPLTSTDLPQPPTGWLDHGYGVLADGTLAILRAQRASLDWHGGSGPRPGMLIHFDGIQERVVLRYENRTSEMKTDRLPDGRWLTVETFCLQRGDSNVRLYRPDGTLDFSFPVGDGVEHVACAADGTIWVSYMDQGVYGAMMRQPPGPGHDGLVCFNAQGEPLWGFNSASHAVKITDCYAMTVKAGDVWICPYTDFPIVQIADGSIRHWKNRIRSASAITVGQGHVILAGGSEDVRNVLTLAKVDPGRDSIWRVGEWQFPWIMGLHLQGRCESLHIIGGGKWMKTDVQTLLTDIQTYLASLRTSR